MSVHSSDSSLELLVAWPVEALEAIATQAGHRTAVVLMVQGVDGFERDLLSSGLARSLARSGVVLFALVGKDSERAHDALDWVIEEAGAEHVLTSWHDENDPDDTASFVVAASRVNCIERIVVAVDERTESGARLRKSIADTIRLQADDGEAGTE